MESLALLTLSKETGRLVLEVGRLSQYEAYWWRLACEKTRPSSLPARVGGIRPQARNKLLPSLLVCFVSIRLAPRKKMQICERWRRFWSGHLCHDESEWAVFRYIETMVSFQNLCSTIFRYWNCWTSLFLGSIPMLKVQFYVSLQFTLRSFRPLELNMVSVKCRLLTRDKMQTAPCRAKLQNTPLLKYHSKSCNCSPAVDIIYIINCTYINVLSSTAVLQTAVALWFNS